MGKDDAEQLKIKKIFTYLTQELTKDPYDKGAGNVKTLSLDNKTIINITRSQDEIGKDVVIFSLFKPTFKKGYLEYDSIDKFTKKLGKDDIPLITAYEMKLTAARKRDSLLGQEEVKGVFAKPQAEEQIEPVKLTEPEELAEIPITTPKTTPKPTTTPGEPIKVDMSYLKDLETEAQDLLLVGGYVMNFAEVCGLDPETIGSEWLPNINALEIILPKVLAGVQTMNELGIKQIRVNDKHAHIPRMTKDEISKVFTEFLADRVHLVDTLLGDHETGGKEKEFRQFLSVYEVKIDEDRLSPKYNKATLQTTLKNNKAFFSFLESCKGGLDYLKQANSTITEIEQTISEVRILPSEENLKKLLSFSQPFTIADEKGEPKITIGANTPYAQIEELVLQNPAFYDQFKQHLYQLTEQLAPLKKAVDNLDETIEKYDAVNIPEDKLKKSLSITGPIEITYGVEGNQKEMKITDRTRYSTIEGLKQKGLYGLFINKWTAALQAKQKEQESEIQHYQECVDTISWGLNIYRKLKKAMPLLGEVNEMCKPVENLDGEQANKLLQQASNYLKPGAKFKGKKEKKAKSGFRLKLENFSNRLRGKKDSYTQTSN